MHIVAAYNIEEQLVVVLSANLNNVLYSLQHYSDQRVSTSFVVSPMPGVIELNPKYTWQFVTDPTLYTLEHGYVVVPCYKDQQH